ELVKKGFKLFERGDVEKDEDDIQYFQRMAEYVYGETVLPVIISLRKGAFRKPVMSSAAKSHIPIIRFKKHSFDVTVLTPLKFTNYGSSVEMTEHVTNVKNPWSVQKSKPKCYDIGRYDKEDYPDEIAFISEGPSDFKDNFDAIICCLIIGDRGEKEERQRFGYSPGTDSDSDDDSDVEDTAVDEIDRQTDMPEGRRTSEFFRHDRYTCYSST
ncbi:Hypothetical predicted protein, partial [Mytilus galloprovincialis]